MIKYVTNPQITNAQTKNLKEILLFKFKLLYRNSINLFHIYKVQLSMLVGISEAICVLLTINLFVLGYIFPDPFYQFKVYPPIVTKQAQENPNKFNEWLAGLIDADGCFILSKKGYASLEITMDIRDKKALFLIKQKFGGSVKLRSGSKTMRYRLHHKEGLINLIKNVNGNIRNPIRLLQLGAICEKYNIVLIFAQPLTYFNGWLSGFMDGDGSILLNQDGIRITATNNIKPLQDNLISLYGGSIYLTNTSGRSFKWEIFKKSEIQDIQTYFKVCPCFSAKFNRFKLIPTYFELRIIKAHLALPSSVNGKLWSRFKKKWENWE